LGFSDAGPAPPSKPPGQVILLIFDFQKRVAIIPARGHWYLLWFGA
jgi:hypothetical protein